MAQTSPGLEKYLLKELKELGIKGKKVDSLNEIEFRANFLGMFKVLHYSRIIHCLKIQVGNQVLARGEKELEQNISKLPWAAFLPVNKLEQYNPPNIRCKSFRSNIFHEKLIRQIMHKFLNLTPIRKEYSELRKLGERHANYIELQRAIQDKNKRIKYLRGVNKRRLQLEHQKESQSVSQQQNSKQQQVIIDNNSDSDFDDIQLSHSKSDKDSLRNKQIMIDRDRQSNQITKAQQKPNLPDIVMYLQKNRLTSLIQIHEESLHKHGLKQFVTWGPIKETIAAAALIKSGIADQIKESGIVKVWDPFCGSGTILLELISMVFNQPVRMKTNFEYFNHWSVFPQDQYDKFLNEVKEKSKINSAAKQEEKVSTNSINLKTFKIIMSDISSKAINSAMQNFKGCELLPIIEQCKNDVKMTEVPFIKQFDFCNNNVNFILSDFEVVANSLIKSLEGFTIISNLPYGFRSKEHIDKQSLVSSFTRFSKLIKKNLRVLANVYIFTVLEEEYRKNHFLKISGLSWELLDQFDSGGIQIGLFKLDKEKSLQVQGFSITNLPQPVIESQEISESSSDQKETSLMVPQDYNKQRELNKEKEKAKFQQLFKKSEFLIKQVKNTIDTRLMKKVKLRKIIHKRRLEFVARQKYKELLLGQKQAEIKQQDTIQQKVTKKRERLSNQIIQKTIAVQVQQGVEKEELAKKLQEKIDKFAEKKSKMIDKKQQTYEKKKKIPKW